MRRDSDQNIVGLKSSVGVVGGGQLAQMLVKAAKKRDVDILVQTPYPSDPAVSQAHKVLIGELDDPTLIEELSDACCCVTFENEWVNIDQLSRLEKEGRCFHPNSSSLNQLVDKISQRKLLDLLNIPGPKWLPLSSSQIGVSKIPLNWDFPLMAKSGRGGYDGKGTKVINNFDDMNILLKTVDPNDWFLETWVSYESELAIVASRDLEGVVRTFPIVETAQINQVCNWVIAPADVTHSVESMAYNIVASLMTHLNYVGVMAVEFFYGPNGLQVNEIAPRTHNSAHFSIDACNSSQFDQQICIAAGLSAPNPKLIVPGAIMINLLGLPEDSSAPLRERLGKLEKVDGAILHWYEKTKEIPGRKLGHVTFLLEGKDANARRIEAFNKLEIIRSIWPMKHGASG